MGAPIHIYPLYENGFRAHRGQSIEENHQESAILYGSFSQTAASNQYAWNYGQKPETAESIGTISKKNRMICFPCRLLFLKGVYSKHIWLMHCLIDPLLMNAFNTVNLGAACIVTSTEFAKQLGVPEEKWIYPRKYSKSQQVFIFLLMKCSVGGAGFRERDLCEYPNFEEFKLFMNESWLLT